MAIRICLDAGHYGKYNRSPVVPQYYESDMVWKLHLMLKEELEKYGFEVITTRTNQNEDLSLYNRGYRAKGCDLFLSLHSNACGSESVDYPVVIANVNDNKYAFDDVSREIGAKLAQVVQETMGTTQIGRMITKKSSNDRDKNGLLDDEYYGVLNGAKAARVASMIIEHSFHTNTKATKWLLNDNNLRKLAINEAKCLSEHYNQIKEVEKVESNTNNEQEKFIEEIAKYVNKHRKSYGIEVASPIIAQAILESAWGTSNKVYSKANGYTHNYFGMKYRNNRCPIASGWFIEGSAEQLLSGEYIAISTKWFKFNSMEDCVIGYFQFTNISNYKSLKGVTNPKTYLENIKKAGYATSLKYVDNLMNVINKYNLTKYDEVQPPLNTPTTQEVKKYYRVRKSWEDAKSQTGAYAILENGIANCQEGYSVFDWNGNLVYTKQSVFYKVIKGDTLGGIAKKFNTTVDALVKLNGISNPNKIYVGQKIKIR